MSDTDTVTADPKPKRTPTEVTVQFVADIPARSNGSQAVRKSKYDAVYAMLAENPGRWAFIGEGKNLHGSLIAYKKRRALEDLTIAWRDQKVYAGVGVALPEGSAAVEPETPAEAADVRDDGGAEAAPTFPLSTGVESASTAGGESDSWA